MKSTLFTRVFGLYLISVAVTVVVLGLVSGLVLTRTARRRAVAELEGAARFTASLLSGGALEEGAGAVGPENLGSLADSIAVLTPDGTVVAGTPIPPSLPPSVAGLEPGSPPVSGFIADGTYRAVAYAAAGVPGSGAPRVVVLTRDRGAIDAATRPALIAVLSTVVAFTVVLGILIHRTLRWIHDPIYAIQAAARRYARGELAVHLRTDGPAELQRLSGDLNLMADELRTRIAAISDQRNQLEAILSSMLEGVIVLDEERGILSMNDAAGRLLGVSPSEAHGRTLIESLRNAQLDELSELALDSDQPIERTVTLYRERPIHVQVHVTPLRSESASRPTGSLLVMNDITRLKHLEDLRKDFVANVSHELKTPVTSIKGFVETLLDGASTDPSTVDRFLQIILNHTNRLHLIIEDLLSLSRLEQSDQRITFHRFPLQAVLQPTLEICGPRARERQIDISHRIEGDDHAWGNPNLLEQALVNLVDNAIKYSPSGSTVKIETVNSERRLLFRVVDQGQGIRAQDLPRIFERFYRTDKARSRELGGTGLGLAIVKHIARAHRGEVTVDSTLGQGATFVIEIPQGEAMLRPSGHEADDDLDAADKAPEQGAEEVDPLQVSRDHHQQ